MFLANAQHSRITCCSLNCLRFTRIGHTTKNSKARCYKPGTSVSSYRKAHANRDARHLRRPDCVLPGVHENHNLVSPLEGLPRPFVCHAVHHRLEEPFGIGWVTPRARTSRCANIMLRVLRHKRRLPDFDRLQRFRRSREHRSKWPRISLGTHAFQKRVSYAPNDYPGHQFIQIGTPQFPTTVTYAMNNRHDAYCQKKNCYAAIHYNSIAYRKRFRCMPTCCRTLCFSVTPMNVCSRGTGLCSGPK